MTGSGTGTVGSPPPPGEEGRVFLCWGQASQVAPGEEWLTPAERGLLAVLKVEKRAADWRLGRWVAKAALAAALGEPALARSDVEVLPSAGGGPSPSLLVPREAPALSLSLSHAAGMGMAVVGVGAGRLGCDVEAIVPRSDDFVSDYFSDREEEWIRAHPERVALRANLVWSAKESALKALGTGLRVDTRSVEVGVEPADGPAEAMAGREWAPLRVVHRNGAVFAGVWRQAAGFVWTVVADQGFRLEAMPLPD